MKLIASLLILSLFLFGCTGYGGQQSTVGPQTQTTISAPPSTSQVPPSSEDGSSVKEFAMTAKQWEFQPAAISVKRGDRVKLTIASIDVAHGFSIPDFNVNTRLEPNQETIVEFTADKTGTFTFFCTVVCGSGHSEMRGSLTVTD